MATRFDSAEKAGRGRRSAPPRPAACEDVESTPAGGPDPLVRLDGACLDVGGEARRLPRNRERVDAGDAVGGLGEPERLQFLRDPGRPRGRPDPPARPLVERYE